jgi:WD40 repeat protein
MERALTLRNSRLKIVLGIVVSMVAHGAAEAADTSSRPAQAESPFKQGTRVTLLTPEQRQNLMQFAASSKTRLLQALDDARGKSFIVANEIYSTAIKEVVMESFKTKHSAELLLRFALNQGLQLTYGVPTPDGAGVEEPGILAGSTNRDLITVILEDSIKLAISYYKDDRRAIESGTLDLPYMRFAMERLELARNWLSSVMEWKYQYRLSIASLRHWHTAASDEGNLHQTSFAAELLHVDDLVRDMPEADQVRPAELPGLSRKLRGELRKLLENTQQKFRQLMKNSASASGDSSRFVTAHSLMNNGGAVNAVAISADGTRVASGSSDGVLKIFDSRVGNTIQEMRGDPSEVLSLAFKPGGAQIASGHKDGTFRIWNVESGDPATVGNSFERSVHSVLFSPDAVLIAVGVEAKSGKGPGLAPVAQVWESKGPKFWKKLVSERGGIGHGLAFSPDGRKLLVLLGGNHLKVWNVITGKLVREWHFEPSQVVKSVAMSSKGDRVAVGFEDGKAGVFPVELGTEQGLDVNSRRQWKELSSRHRGPINAIEFSGDGKQLVTASEDSTAMVWDSMTGKALQTLEGHRGSITSLAFSPDGTQIVTGSQDGTTRIWTLN